ncbi:hypothetical protein MPER_12459 [Moniliophthora perniciosa FA553]|nr:hypothetical protein MPER_12459 [Moniliophthora perniciosa FA553]
MAESLSLCLIDLISGYFAVQRNHHYHQNLEHSISRSRQSHRDVGDWSSLRMQRVSSPRSGLFGPIHYDSIDV